VRLPSQPVDQSERSLRVRAKSLIFADAEGVVVIPPRIEKRLTEEIFKAANEKKISHQ
jgi:regulator of RNase E activity RraA